MPFPVGKDGLGKYELPGVERSVCVLKRLISGVIGAIILLAVVLSGVLPLRIGIALVSALMVYELCKCVGASLSLLIPSAIYAALLSCEVIPLQFQRTVMCVFLLWILTTALVRHKTIHIQEVALSALSAFFVGCFMSCITKIRLEAGGAYWIWFVFFGAWLSDVFAYFSGYLFGKRKLIPSVSPKKTVAGAVGGAIGAAVGFVVFGYFTRSYLGDINLLILFATGIIAAVCGQIGDLVASVIKRQYGIKDYGNIMPGHGGAMDRFDSILFVAPVMWLYLQLLHL